MKKILLLLLALYGFSAYAEAFQIRADRPDPDRLAQNGIIHSWGSAFYVGKYHLLTCWHTLKDGEKIFVKVKDGWAQCDLVRADKDNDMALLVTKVPGEPIAFADIPVLTAEGAPHKFPPELMKIRSTPADMDVSYIRAGVDRGDSGGPVMADGRLIGMVLARVEMDDTVYAKIVGVMKIAEFLK